MISKTILKIGAASAFCLAATTAHAGQLISAAGIQDGTAGNVSQVTDVAGNTAAISTTDATARAQTSYGINRIYNQGAAGMDGESYASSVWGQSFVAQGTGMVHVAFTFTLDGSVNYGAGGSGRDFNYILSALAGDWSLSSANGYDDISASHSFASTEAAGGVMQNFTGQTVFALDEIGSMLTTTATGSAGATLERTLTKNGDAYFLSTTTQNPSTQVDFGLYPDHFTANTIANGMPLPYAAVPALLQTYNSIRSNYAVLGQASLCHDTPSAHDSGCLSGAIAPTPLTLEFDIMGGSTFTLFSSLTSEDAEDGTVDFFNTVRLTDIAATGGTLTSDNSQFAATGDGHYGFSNITGAVPEPSTWIMLILGFGLVGAAMRQKPNNRATAARA
jgi:hypothetical protein